MFDKYMGMLPVDLIPEIQEVAREVEERFIKKEFTESIGMVRVTVVHPGKVTKIEVEDKFFTIENKNLLLELIPVTTEKALDSMSSEWRDQLQEAGEKIKEIVARFNEKELSDNKEPKAPDSEDENLN